MYIKYRIQLQPYQKCGTINQHTVLYIFYSIGFAQERQFQLNPIDDNFGNRVTFVSTTLSFPCDVERDSTHGGQILCYTRQTCRPKMGWFINCMKSFILFTAEPCHQLSMAFMSLSMVLRLSCAGEIIFIITADLW